MRRKFGWDRDALVGRGGRFLRRGSVLRVQRGRPDRVLFNYRQMAVGGLMEWPEDMKVILHKAGEPMVFEPRYKLVCELCPIEAHVKPDGAKDDSPSVLFVLQSPGEQQFFAQVSYKMLMPLIRELARTDWAQEMMRSNEDPNRWKREYMQEPPPRTTARCPECEYEYAILMGVMVDHGMPHRRGTCPGSGKAP